MNISQYQSLTNQFAVYPIALENEYLALGLASEVGEVTALFKRAIRDNKPLNQQELVDELGDVLWYISQLCNANDIDLEAVLDNNIAKLTQRKANGTIKGKGKR